MKILSWIFKAVWSLLVLVAFIAVTIAYNIGNITVEAIKYLCLGSVWFVKQPWGTRLILGILISAVIFGIPGYFYQRSVEYRFKAIVEHDNTMLLAEKLTNANKTIEEKDQTINKLKKAVGLTDEQKLALKVKKYFPSDYQTALMVIKHESGMNPRAQGWNCTYLGISTACLPWDRASAWSVDCGIMQNNLVGYKNCPEWSFDVDWGLKTGQEKYQRRGWTPWVAYNNGRYLIHKEWAQNIINEQDQFIALGITE